MEFTKEQLQQIEAVAKEVLWPVVWSEKKARKHFSEKITPEVVLELARIALASLEAEPVAYMSRQKAELREKFGTCDEWDLHHQSVEAAFPSVNIPESDNYEFMPLYTAPPASVSVPDERAAFNSWNNDIDCPLAGRDAKTAAWLAWSRRAAMPPVIPDGWVLMPEEPTHEMLEAGDEQFGTYDVYRRMIAAAPKLKHDLT